MKKGPGDKEFVKVVRPEEWKNHRTAGISDLAEKLGYQYSTERPLPTSIIDKHGLLKGLFNVYINPLDGERRKRYHCEMPECDSILQEYYLRLVAVMDSDAEWYTINAMAKEPSIYQALLETNRKVILCLEHRSPAIEVVNPTLLAPTVSLDKAREKRKRHWKKPGF